MRKYGLQLRVPPSQQKKQSVKPPLPPPLGFRDDDEDDVEQEISRHASKNRALKVEEQHKKALEEDPSVFDYDGVYDEMKEKVARPVVQERQERKVTKSKNLSDFYLNLPKNVAFGSEDPKKRGGELKTKEASVNPVEEKVQLKHFSSVSVEVDESHQEGTSTSRPSEERFEAPKESNIEKLVEEQPKQDHHKRSEVKIAAAIEQLLARKRAKQQ